MCKFQYVFLFITLTCLILTGCDSTPEPEKENELIIPEMTKDFVSANPSGEDNLSYEIIIKDDWPSTTWSIISVDSYDWISVSPSTGTGNGTVLFNVEQNLTEKERSAYFNVVVSEYKTYEILVSQGVMDYNVNEDDLEFLRTLVDGSMLGEETPDIDNWHQVSAGAFPGITMIDLGGQLFIERIDGTPFVDFPEKMHLSELNHISVTDRGELNGKRLPSDWHTPKLVFINMKGNRLTGPIPDGLAASPMLVELYLDDNNFFGALPHIWASETLKVVILANYATPASEDAGETTDNPGLGYIVPRSLDVLLNNYNESGDLDNHPMFWHDKTQFKLGGVAERNWLGFEKGWGQKRYEEYDESAQVGNISVWSDHRLLIDDWAWFFTNVGHTSQLGGIPRTMMDWDQDAADAYTALCEAQAE